MLYTFLKYSVRMGGFQPFPRDSKEEEIFTMLNGGRTEGSSF